MRMIKRMGIWQLLMVMLLINVVFFATVHKLHYFSYRSESLRWAESSADLMMDQVEENIQTIVNNVHSTAVGLSYNPYIQQLLLSETPSQSMELYQYYQQITYSTKIANNVIYGIWFIGDNGRWISDPVSDGNAVVQKVAQDLPLSNSSFQNAVFCSLMEGRPHVYYSSYAFPVYSLQSGGSTKIGSGILLLDISELQKTLAISSITENSMFCVLDADNTVVASNGGYKTGERYHDVFWTPEAENISMETEHRGLRCNAQYRRLKDTGWSIVSIIPISELTVGVAEFWERIGLLTALCVLLLLLLDYTLMRNMAVSIGKTVSFLQNEKDRSLSVRMEEPQQKDIAVIVRGINQMLDSVEEMTENIISSRTQLYETKLAEQDAMIVALQSQINPHFLYNTLNCLANIGYAYDIPEVSDVSVAMARIYRYCTEWNRFAKLSQELQCINEYFRIMEVRFPGKVELTVNVPEELTDIPVLRMTLQPLVENAFQHGLEAQSGRGHLSVIGEVEEKNLVLRVTNDGKPISPEELNQIYANMQDYGSAGVYERGKTRIGLANINKRIKLQYGDAYGVKIESDAMRGTVVSIKIPLTPDLKEE